MLNKVFDMFAKKDKKMIQGVTEENAKLRDLIESKDKELLLAHAKSARLEKRIKELRPLTKMDVIRRSLGIVPILDFTTLADDDLPKSFLPADVESTEYKAKVGELAMVYRNKTFRDMIEHLVNVQGNFNLRHADTAEKKQIGLFVVTGIEMVFEMIQSAYKKYEKIGEEANETYDEHEVSVSATAIADELLDNN